MRCQNVTEAVFNVNNCNWVYRNYDVLIGISLITMVVVLCCVGVRFVLKGWIEGTMRLPFEKKTQDSGGTKNG